MPMSNHRPSLIPALIPWLIFLALPGCDGSDANNTDSTPQSANPEVEVHESGITIPRTLTLQNGEVRFAANNTGDGLCYLHFQSGSTGWGMDIEAHEKIDFSIELEPGNYQVSCDSYASANYQDYYAFAAVPVTITNE